MPWRLISIAIESTRKGMSSLTNSITVDAASQPSSVNLGLKMRIFGAPGWNSLPNARCESESAVHSAASRATKSSASTSLQYLAANTLAYARWAVSALVSTSFSISESRADLRFSAWVDIVFPRFFIESRLYSSDVAHIVPVHPQHNVLSHSCRFFIELACLALANRERHSVRLLD